MIHNKICCGGEDRSCTKELKKLFFWYFQQILKEPKMAASIMNPYVKRSVKVKSLNDMTAKERFSPLTCNLISKY